MKKQTRLGKEFKKPRRHVSREQRRLKNDFTFHLQISRFSYVISFVFDYQETESGTVRNI